MTSVPFWHDFCTLESLWHDFCTLGVGVPKLPPCCPGAGACPPSKIRSGTWFLRTEPLVGKLGPTQCGRRRCTPSNRIDQILTNFVCGRAFGIARFSMRRRRPGGARPPRRCRSSSRRRRRASRRAACCCTWAAAPAASRSASAPSTRPSASSTATSRPSRCESCAPSARVGLQRPALGCAHYPPVQARKCLG